MTKAELANAAGLADYRSVTAYEAGETVPGPETLPALAKVLRFPMVFFEGPDLQEPSDLGASFRGLKTMKAEQRDSALGAGALAIEFAHWLEANFSLPPPRIPNLKRFEPEAAAAALRGGWTLGERPIKNMVHLLEVYGVRIFALPAECAQVDAFSIWHGDTPYVFLNTTKSGERSRFDAAHELGHLTLHRHGPPNGRKAEQEADRFASAFLMPRGSILASAPRLPNLDALIRAKKAWGVSVAALAHRLHGVGLLSDWHYRRLCIQIAQRGFRKQEPDGIARETSQVLTKVFAALRNDHIGRVDIARQLLMAVEELDSMTFGLVIGAVPGGRREGLGPPRGGPVLRPVS